MNTLRGRRRLLGLVVVALAFGVPSPGDAAVRGVDEIGSSFSPPRIEIGVNDKVVWTNRSSLPHSVTFDRGPDLHQQCNRILALGCQGPGQTAERTFTELGRFPYYCKIHGGPGGQGMSGVVVVAAPDAEDPVSTSTTVKASSSTTATTAKATSSTTSTTRVLATSSTLASSSTTSTTPDTSSVLLPGDPPPFSGDDVNSSAAGRAGGPDNGSDSTTVVLIVALLLAVSAGGGYLLWRLRPGRA